MYDLLIAPFTEFEFMRRALAGTLALAMLRLDRVAEAQRKGEPLTAGGVPISVRKPAWANFDIAPPAAAEAP